MGFQIGDMVVYGIHGVCKIADTEVRIVDRKTVEYFVLVPINQKNAKFYLPMHNPSAVSKIRNILTREQLTALLQSEQIKEDDWILNEAARKEKYRDLITQADCGALIRTLRALEVHKQQQRAEGKKLHICDENFMKDAERVIRLEVAAVMDIPLEQVGDFIRGIIVE